MRTFHFVNDNSERLIVVLEHTITPDTILPLALLYIPPSSSLQQFQTFLTATFTDIAELQCTQGLTPVILTDANAHCVTGLDDFRNHGIPNRSLPYNRNKRSKSLTPQGKRGTVLEQLSKLNEYVILNNRAKGDNNSPTFTAHHRRSVIDYILVPRQHYIDVVAFDILGDTNTQFNTDHNMLHLICNSLDFQPNFQNPNGLDKDAILFPKFALIDLDTRAKYQAAIEKHLKPFVIGGGYKAIVQQGRQCGHSNQQIADAINATILTMIRTAAEEVLGSTTPTSFTTAPLPLWWDPESSHLTAKLRTYTALLKSLTKTAASRSRPVLRILASISATRKQLRSSTAKARAKHDKSYHRHVSRHIHKSLLRPKLSNKLSWRLVQARRNTRLVRTSLPLNMKQSNGTLSGTPRDSANAWTSAWSNVSKHDEFDARFDTDATATAIHRFETWLQDLRSSTQLQPTADHDRPFKPKQTARALRHLKNFKRHGADGIAPDLLRHGGHLLVQALNLAHNFYLQHGVHPQAWNVSPAMPLHKSGHRTDPMNYRIIAFMCALCKAYDGALAERLTDWAKKFNILAPTQYGYREQSETIDMWYTYVQVIRERQTRGLPTYLASLDVKKAFPSVPRYILWNYCRDKGMRGRLILALINMAESARLWLMVPTATPDDSYPLEQGVREGSLTSPILYIIFANSIITVLRQQGCGTTHRGVFVGASLFADDLSVLVHSVDELNKVLDLISSQGRITRTYYNAAKTQVLIFQCSPATTLLHDLWPHSAPHIRMGTNRLTPVAILKLLGIRVSSSLNFQAQLSLSPCSSQ